MRNSVTSNRPRLTRRTALSIPAALGASFYAGRWAWAAGPQRGGILRASTYANPTSLDPMTSRSGADINVVSPLFEALVDFEPNTLEPKPGLATAWEWPNSTTLVFDLRQGVVFHDGTPFDAAAVKANLDRNMKDTRSTIASLLDAIKSVEVAGPYKVVLNLSKPDTALPMVLSDQAGLMSSPKAFTTHGANYDRNPVGTGPMEFVSWADGDEIVLKRNTKYWKPDLPHLDGIVFKVITDTNTGARSVVAGQNDFAFRVDPQQIVPLRRSPGVEVNVFNTLRVIQCYINFSRPPYNDVRVRQAMQYAIDREAFTKVVLGGFGEVANLYVPKSHWAYDAQAAARYPYDPDRAKKLLADAGYAGGIKLHANYYSDQLSIQRIEILGSYWSKVGITIDKKTTGTLADTNKLWREGAGDIRLAAWGGRPDPSITYGLLFLPDGFFNIGNAEPSPELTKAINASRTVTGQAERKAIMAQVVRLEREAAMSLPLSFEPEVTVYRPAVKNYIPNLAGRPRIESVYLET